MSTFNSPLDPFTDTFWIIRSAGERTTEACISLIRQFIPADRVSVVSERPFSAALRKTFAVGAGCGYKWAVCIDADVFVHADGFRQLLAVAEAAPRHVWYVQGLTVDRFIPIYRTAGTGIYRSARMHEAIDHVPPDGTCLRPETVTMKQMIVRHRNMYRTPIVVGMHDFEQAHHDIVRKAYLHYHKHDSVREEMVAHWQLGQDTEPDFATALLGVSLSQRADERLFIDRAFKQQEIAAALVTAGIPAKPPLDDGKITPAYVADCLAGFRTHAELQTLKFPGYRDYLLMWPRFNRIRRALAATAQLPADLLQRLRTRDRASTPPQDA